MSVQVLASTIKSAKIRFMAPRREQILWENLWIPCRALETQGHSLVSMISAGFLLFYQLTPEQRYKAIEAARSFRTETPPDLRTAIKTLTDARTNYEMLTPDDQLLLAALREAMTNPPAKENTA